jgi:hypothetical protein
MLWISCGESLSLRPIQFQYCFISFETVVLQRFLCFIVFQQIACCFSKCFSSGSGQPKNVSVGRKKMNLAKNGFVGER